MHERVRCFFRNSRNFFVVVPFHASFHREAQSGSISFYFTSYHFLSFNIHPFGLIDIRDVIYSLSLSIYGKSKNSSINLGPVWFPHVKV
jgi:hypothetical protein